MTKYKLLILALCAALALGAVLFFLDTRIGVPAVPKPDNPHATHAARALDSLKATKDLVGNKAPELSDTAWCAWRNTKGFLNVCRDEKLVDETQYRKLRDAAAVAYADILVAQFRTLSAQDEWPIGTRLAVRLRTDLIEGQLESCTTCKPARVAELRTACAEAAAACKDYNIAESLAKNTTYANAEQAQHSCDVARRIVQDGRIAKCTSLVNAMDAYPTRVGQSHFDMLYDLATNIRRANTVAAAQRAQQRFEQTADDYTANANARYGGGHPRDIADQRNRASQAFQDVCDTKCFLDINTHVGSGTETGLTFSASEQQWRVSVITNHPDGFRITGATASFYTLTTDDDSFLISLQYNPGAQRKDTFYIKAGKRSLRFTVTQN